MKLGRCFLLAKWPHSFFKNSAKIRELNTTESFPKRHLKPNLLTAAAIRLLLAMCFLSWESVILANLKPSLLRPA
jgi:hypothetical protein